MGINVSNVLYQMRTWGVGECSLYRREFNFSFKDHVYYKQPNKLAIAGARHFHM